MISKYLYTTLSSFYFLGAGAGFDTNSLTIISGYVLLETTPAFFREAKTLSGIFVYNNEVSENYTTLNFNTF